jgi:hypothetical protein
MRDEVDGIPIIYCHSADFDVQLVAEVRTFGMKRQGDMYSWSC